MKIIYIIVHIISFIYIYHHITSFKIPAAFNPEIPPPGIYSKKEIENVDEGSHTSMFPTMLFIILTNH